MSAGPFQIGPDGVWAVYLADQEVDGRIELFSRRVDGSGAPAKLNAALPSGGSVANPVITADSLRVVFSGDQLVDQRFELFKTPISGGALRRLNPPLVPGGDVGQSAVSPDERLVVYAADQETNDMQELFAAPLVGPGLGPRGGAAAAPTLVAPAREADQP